MQKIELRVHSLVLELTGKKEPQDGLQGKFSVYHGCAAGLIFGRAGEEEFSDEVVTREDVVALRRKVVAVVDDSIREESVVATATLTDGRVITVNVEHAIGSLQRPMSDAALERKFSDQAVPVIGAARTAALAWPLLRAAQALLAEMASFDSAGVSRRSADAGAEG